MKTHYWSSAPREHLQAPRRSHGHILSSGAAGPPMALGGPARPPGGPAREQPRSADVQTGRARPTGKAAHTGPGTVTRAFNEDMASLRLGIAASLKEAKAAKNQVEVPAHNSEKMHCESSANRSLPTSPASQQKKRGKKKARAQATPPPKRSKPRAAREATSKPTAPCDRDGTCKCRRERAPAEAHSDATVQSPASPSKLSYDSVAPNPIGVPPPTPQLVYEKDMYKEACATWAELAESVQKSPGRFDAAARRLQALLLPPAAKPNAGFPRGAPARAAEPHDAENFPGPFYTTSPDMKDTKIADKVEELLEATYEEAKECHTKGPGKDGVTTDDCVRIVKRLLVGDGRFADIEYMCDEKRFPARVLILADIVRARMHYNWTTTRCRLEYIQPEAHASPDDIVMRDDKGLQFIVLRSLDGRRPFAAPCADLARSLEDIARHDPRAREFGVKIGTHDRPIVYQAAWKAGEVPNVYLKGSKNKKNEKGITTFQGGRPRPQLQERVRHHLTEIYLIARRYLYQQLLPHETAARAFDMRPWLGDRDEATPRIPLLSAVWGLFPAAAAHQDNDVAPGLLAMCDCNAPPAEGEDPDQTPPTGPQRALQGNGFYFPCSGEGDTGTYVSLSQGDLVLFDPNVPHCVTEPWYRAEDTGPPRVRYLVSCFYNEKHLVCARHSHGEPTTRDAAARRPKRKRKKKP